MDAAPTLAAAYAGFLADLTLAGRSPATVRTYRSLLRHFAADTRPITALTDATCRHLLAGRIGQSRSTLRTYSGALSAFCIYLSAAYPFTRPSFPTPKDQPRPHRYLSRDELRRVFAACPDDTYRLLVLLLMEGLRAGEALGLRWRDLSGDTALIHGKGGTLRHIVLSPAIMDMLARRPETGPRILGFSYTVLRKKVMRLGKLAKVPGLHPHTFRHTWASWALLEGMDEGALRTLGGWSARSQMVERYTASVREQAALKRSRDFALTDRLLGDMATEPP